MPSKFTRRDFLKAAATLSLAPLVGKLPAALQAPQSQVQKPPNVIVVIFDAMSARHLSLYGYPRKTSPNLERLAQRATVYHAHHSAANFTAPSTVSLFTGTYPWTHRVFSLGGMPRKDLAAKNWWPLLADTYYLSAFVQNMYADLMLYQLHERLDSHLGPKSFGLGGRPFYDRFFAKDAYFGAKSIDQFVFDPKERPGSLFLSVPNDLLRRAWEASTTNRLLKTYPEGVPSLDGTNVLFTIDQVVEGAKGYVSSLPAPFLTYLHFMPPHTPYRPSREFLGMFEDGWAPPNSKKHILADGIARERLLLRRREYDEFIANMDAEFGKFIDHFYATGLWENTYLFITSDHGEMCEKGEQGHVTPLLFEPVIHVPLIIAAPGQNQRQDIYTPTSNVDVLPTLMKIAGQNAPDTCEGQILPGLGLDEQMRSGERSLFAIEAKRNAARSPLQKFSVAMMRENYKLVRYKGYRNNADLYEFYDLENDPEEKTNQYSPHPIIQEMQAEMEAKLKEVDQPYMRAL